MSPDQIPHAAEQAVCFLWHLPAGFPDWALPSTLLFGVRTFLPAKMNLRPKRDPKFLAERPLGLHPYCTSMGDVAKLQKLALNIRRPALHLFRRLQLHPAAGKQHVDLGAEQH